MNVDIEVSFPHTPRTCMPSLGSYCKKFNCLLSIHTHGTMACIEMYVYSLMTFTYTGNLMRNVVWSAIRAIKLGLLNHFIIPMMLPLVPTLPHIVASVEMLVMAMHMQFDWL